MARKRLMIPLFTALLFTSFSSEMGSASSPLDPLHCPNVKQDNTPQYRTTYRVYIDTVIEKGSCFLVTTDRSIYHFLMKDRPDLAQVLKLLNEAAATGEAVSVRIGQLPNFGPIILSVEHPVK